MAAAAGTPAAKLLDFSQPLDVPLLDATVTAFYGAASTEEVSVAAGFCYI
jgi:exportin-1